MRSWKLWELPRRVLYLVLPVDIIAVATTVAMAGLYPVTRLDVLHLAVLAGCVISYTEGSRSLERRRESARGFAPYMDLKSVWNVAALLLLPPVLAMAVVLFAYGYAWLYIWRKGTVPLYRWVYSCATVLLGSQLAVVVLALGSTGYPGLPAAPSSWVFIALAFGVRWLTNYLLVVFVIRLSQPETTFRELVSTFRDQALEIVTTALAIVVVVAITLLPELMLVVVMVFLALQRVVLVNRFELAAETDGKTGLYKGKSWTEHAQLALTRARPRHAGVGLLLIDIDRFKSVNDTYGHVTGDEVLIAVAKSIKDEVRDDVDIVGRWGGEEFVVLVPDITAGELRQVAERIRMRVKRMTVPAEPRIKVTVSIGAALFPVDGESLNDLLSSADSAMYAAKRDGRDQVRVATASDNRG